METLVRRFWLVGKKIAMMQFAAKLRKTISEQIHEAFYYWLGWIHELIFMLVVLYRVTFLLPISFLVHQKLKMTRHIHKRDIRRNLDLYFFDEPKPNNCTYQNVQLSFYRRNETQIRQLCRNSAGFLRS